MRKITRDSVNALFNAMPFKRQNMEIEVLPNVTIMKLHNNPIAYLYNNPERTLSITNAGWDSNTIKERLNAVINEYYGYPECINKGIYQKRFKWYLNGELWDGSMVDL